MGRTIKSIPKPFELPLIDEQSITNTMNAMSSMQSEYNQARDLVNQLLGQAQMANAFGKFSQTVWAYKLNFVKENKLYRNLAGKKTPNGLDLKGTWQEFCSLLGISDEKANQDIANLKAFGEEALEAMSKMGIGYRELRQYRKLPEDQKTALIQVARAGDKDALIELAQELIAKNAKEKEQLKQANADLQADYKALSQRNADVAKEKEQLAIKLLQFEMKTVPLDERLEPLKKQIAQTQSRIDELFEQQRQYVQLVDQLQKQIMVDDPNYDPEQPYTLPQSLIVTILTLHESLKLTVVQSQNTYRNLLMHFGDEIDSNNVSQVING